MNYNPILINQKFQNHRYFSNITLLEPTQISRWNGIYTRSFLKFFFKKKPLRYNVRFLMHRSLDWFSNQIQLLQSSKQHKQAYIKTSSKNPRFFNRITPVQQGVSQTTSFCSWEKQRKKDENPKKHF